MNTRCLILAAIVVSAGAGLALTPAPALADDAGFSCADRSGGATAEVQAELTSVRFAHHAGYDRVVFGFANAPAVPAYRLTQQASATFTQGGGKGTTYRLAGTAGLFSVFNGTLWTDGVPLTDARPGLPVVREVASVENFEGVTSYGIGLSRPACFRTMELSGPSRLVVDFAVPGDQPATPSVNALAQTGGGASLPLASVALLGLGLALAGFLGLLAGRRSWRSKIHRSV
jgi:hypothetical protein